MASAPRSFLTPAEYLAAERAATEKSEYFAGEIVAMSGASRNHNRIALNLAAQVHAVLRGGSCEAFAGDMRVQVDETGAYVYPDLVGVCGEPQFTDSELDTLVNPVLVVEILSPSTERHDRGPKFAHYRQMASLQEILFVSQHEKRVELYRRQDDHWVLTDYIGNGTVPLASIRAELRLDELYERVEFPSSELPASE